MKSLTKIIFFVGILLVSCTEEPKTTTIFIQNNLELSRTFETVTLSKSDLKLHDTINLYEYVIQNKEGVQQVTQYEDTNKDGLVDIILFQPEVKAKSSITYNIVHIPNAELPERKEICYSRFVPERTDDYAWENDKVAFRVYGPTAQKMKEENVEGGTLSSGIDCWLKRVKYPIINKWYKKQTDTTGTYHEDTGEGLDNYHVGTSRGCGGIAVKGDTTYYISKNYIKYKRLMTGPIRTQFSLEYANWDANGKSITETRVLTLDKGNNLTKHSISLHGTNKISIGLTLHKKDGKITKNKEQGWISYWENLDDSELGTGIVVTNPIDITGFDIYVSDTDNVKNQYLESELDANEINYYSGFGWKKSKQFHNNKEWNTYLTNFSKRLKSPLEVTIK